MAFVGCGQGGRSVLYKRFAMMNNLKLDQALARKRRALRILLISAVGFTIVAVIDGCVGMAGGRPVTTFLIIFIFFKILLK